MRDALASLLRKAHGEFVEVARGFWVTGEPSGKDGGGDRQASLEFADSYLEWKIRHFCGFFEFCFREIHALFFVEDFGFRASP